MEDFFSVHQNVTCLNDNTLYISNSGSQIECCQFSILNSQISTEKRLETLVCLVRTCNKTKVRFCNFFHSTTVKPF